MDNRAGGDSSSDLENIAASLERPEAFAPVFQHNFTAIHRYLSRRVGTSLADDLAATTFTVAFERRRTFNPGIGAVRPWLYGIATNLLRNHLRAEHRLLDVIARASAADVMQEPLDSDGAIARLDASMETVRIAATLRDLDPEQRDVLLLFAIGQLTYQEIATVLAIPAGTVASRLSRLREELRSRLMAPVEDHQPHQEIRE